MKKTVIAMLALGAGLTLSNAATTISGANNTGTTSAIPFVDSAGVPVALSYQVGTFGALPDFGAVALDLSGFSGLGGPASFSSGIDGLLAGAPLNLGAQSAGGALYVVVGNNAAFGSATDYIVLSLGINNVNEIVGNGSISFNVETLSSSNHAGDVGVVGIERGYSTTVSPTGYPAAPFNAFNGGPALAFGIIPEPSSTLLLGLGGLGLLIRRKR